MFKLKKGDQVIILSGRDKGKQGEVIKSIPKSDRIIVQGVNLVQKHTGPTQTSAGGIIKKELSIHISNVAMIDPKEKVASRVGIRNLEDGTKVRYSKLSGEVID
ncbi:MAG: 50S ribosomal protein L24 [Alphaproteobacteria bacterium TMED87]|nr:50S ribosomal protein L24 [Rhodospirillaceae bacterium]OUV08331.1 MAG: 50S ribosomal protein L24 [Alphaproteobacteria bacterium TMED87]|tara:strand:- start:534 stop:845 length:312 start_codon:yes stop_codon:yes gene_type:complete